MSFSKFFSNLQESPWYHQFLFPVIEQVEQGSKILDIGTGSGKMLQLLNHKKEIIGIGIDTDPAMLKEARKKLVNTNIRLVEIKDDTNYPFENEYFDYITICNVLFNL